MYDNYCMSGNADYSFLETEHCCKDSFTDVKRKFVDLCLITLFLSQGPGCATKNHLELKLNYRTENESSQPECSV